MQLSENQIIRADFLPEPARVKKFEKRGSYYRLEVTLEDSGTYRPLNLTEDQVAQIKVAEQNPVALSSDPEEFFLLIEAHRIRLAYQFDPLLAVSVSQVDPLPHQIEAVYHHALEALPLRFLIADDPGAGKTIMAGLILKELQYRGLVNRVLIVAPGHLKYQWQREMKEKFDTTFRLINRHTMRSHWGENTWEENPLAISSIDFLKQDDIKATLSGSMWDLVIVDEAHKMSAYAYETKEGTKTEKTKRYQVGEVLSRQAERLLFLTATPHKGDEENFRLFLDLLRPGFFAKTEMLKESVQQGENPLFIRRMKEDMKTFDGTPIFPPRTVQTAKFKMTDDEIDLYNAVTSYVKNYFDQAKENPNVAFAMVILQRRLTSSTHAILSSLIKRREKLDDYLHYPEQIKQEAEAYERVAKMTDEDLADLAEEDLWEAEEKLMRLTIASNKEEVEAEIDQLDELIKQAEALKRKGTETKLQTLRDEVLSILDGRKLLIFTEHKDTLWYLDEKLREWGYSVNLIHGGMHLDDRIEAERTFRDETQIMVATEAAGEGINLQFCSLMVNYDIPWNPNRLEQRMGRIHRYGQDREVFIWNLVSRDTREGKILEKLFLKLDRMKEALGTDRVFDIIGELIPGKSLRDLLKDAIFSQRKLEEVETTLEQVDEGHTSAVLENVFKKSLATRHIDYTGLMKEQLEAQENRLVPEYVQDYFLRGFERMEGKYTPLETGFRIDKVPFELRRFNKDPDFTRRYGKVARRYSRVTFDKAIARSNPKYEFVAPGHALLEALTEVVLRQFRGQSSHFAAFSDPESGREGAIWFVEGVVRDGTGDVAGRRVFCVLQGADGEMSVENPAILWDMTPQTDADVPDATRDAMADESAIQDYLIEEVLFPYQEEIQDRREHDADVKERYGLKSLDYFLQESNQKLLDYQVKADAGKDMALAIRNEEEEKRQLEARRDALRTQIEREQNVTVEEPKILGVAALVAPKEIYVGDDEVSVHAIQGEKEVPYELSGDDQMHRNDEIEQVGMDVASAYEEERGWEVEDVSQKSHGGFDLRSIRYDEDGGLADVRYIEVKARAQTGGIRLTSNEWKKARQFGPQYWLYIITDAGTDTPDLKRIQDPAARFKENEDIYATGFIIPEDRWRQLEPTK